MVGMSKKIGSLFAGAALLLAGVSTHAEDFPSKPVHILVPYAAGGAVDVLARTLGQSLAKIWRQQPVIDNRPGAGGIVASQALTQAPADGYTLILVASGHPLNQFIYPSLPYDTFKDFTAITEIASSSLAVVVSKKSPYTDLNDLLAMARKDPDALSYGMSGNGTSAHLAGELLKYMTGVKILSIPYKGGAPALTAVIAGDIPMSINPLAEVVGQLEQGPLRAMQ
jgi:tripartite-type tricarboxylate transporter receptor subunit TctC